MNKTNVTQQIIEYIYIIELSMYFLLTKKYPREIQRY